MWQRGRCAYSCVGLASQQSAQYSAVDELRTASTGALFLRARLLVDCSRSYGRCPGARIPDRGCGSCMFLKFYLFEIHSILAGTIFSEKRASR